MLITSTPVVGSCFAPSCVGDHWWCSEQRWLRGVSRSYRAKAMGIKMGCPTFRYASRLRRMAGVTFSSIMPSVMVICRAVMSTLETMAPELEVYSIDEAFLALSASFAGDPPPMGSGSASGCSSGPASRSGVGIGPPRPSPNWPTMPPKVACHRRRGRCIDELRQARLDGDHPGWEEVWGWAPLDGQVTNGKPYTRWPIWSPVMPKVAPNSAWWSKRIVQELRGLCLCAELAVEPAAKQQILSSRSFGERITEVRGNGTSPGGVYGSRSREAAGGGNVLPAGAPVCAHQPVLMSGPHYSGAGRGGWSAQPMTPACCCSKWACCYRKFGATAIAIKKRA